jgi:hypothetical protein
MCPTFRKSRRAQKSPSPSKSHAPAEPFTGPVILDLIFILRRPKTLCRRKDPDGLISMPDRRARMQGIVDAVADQLDAYGMMFPGGFKLTTLSRGGGLAYNPETKTLEIDLNRVSRQLVGTKNPARLVQATMREEVIHRAATDVLSREEVTRLWERLPDALIVRRLSDLGVKKVVSESEEGRFVENDGGLNDGGLRPSGEAYRPGDVVETRDSGHVGSVPASDPTKTGGNAPAIPVAGNQEGVFDSGSNVSIQPGLFAELGDRGVAYTDNNDAIEFVWAVAELNNLSIFNEENGAVNPRYPKELQPRDRSTAGSQLQVEDIARNANFDRLSIAENVGGGAPIVGPTDGVAESGNGRLMGLRPAYDRGVPSIQTYRQKLEENAGKFGLAREKIAGMKRFPGRRAGFCSPASGGPEKPLTPEEVDSYLRIRELRRSGSQKDVSEYYGPYHVTPVEDWPLLENILLKGNSSEGTSKRSFSRKEKKLLAKLSLDPDSVPLYFRRMPVRPYILQD